jgi:hypothetical protein
MSESRDGLKDACSKPELILADGTGHGGLRALSHAEHMRVEVPVMK